MLSPLKKRRNFIEFGREYYTFWSVHVLSDVFAMTFFQIMLYRATGLFETIVISNILNSILVFVGVLLGSVFIDRFGYLKMFRTANLLSAVGLLITALLLGDVAKFYPLFSVLIFIPRGLFWATNNTYELRENADQSRRVNLNATQGIYILASVVLGPLVGYMLAVFDGYAIVFVVAALICLFSVLIPFKYNKVPRSNLTVSEVLKIVRSKKFPLFFTVFFIVGAFAAAISLVGLLVSYLVLGNEFNIGVVASIVSIVAGLMLLVKKKISRKATVDVGYISNGLIVLGNFVFFLFWVPGVFIVNKLLGASLSGWSASTLGDQDYQARERLLGKDLRQSAVEINLVVEVIWLIARVFTGIAIVLLVQSVSRDSVNDLIKYIFGFSGFYAIIAFILYRLFNNRYKGPDKEVCVEV